MPNGQLPLDASIKKPGNLEAKIGDLIVLATNDGEYVAGFVRSTSYHGVELAHQRFGHKNLSGGFTRGRRNFQYCDFQSPKVFDGEDMDKRNEPKNCDGTRLGDVNIGDLVVLMTRDGEYVAGFLKDQTQKYTEVGRPSVYLAAISYQRFGHRNLSSSGKPGDRVYELSKFLQYFVINETMFNPKTQQPQ